MRLLHSKTYELREFVDNEAIKAEYAILSHTWDREEVIFQDLQSWTVRYSRKLGWKKIEYGCRQARQDGISWIWMDTVCIDKSSSTELSEAINSMFKWYRDAKVCYAYLADIPAVRWSSRDHYSCFQDSRWFSRGWTLQELLAPQRMILYGTDWDELGTRENLSELISQVSGIQVLALQGHEKEINSFSVAQRMCWASRRETTRSEDMAYCLLGLFDVNMPLLYGEGGKKAFIRLQEEIMKNSDDHTLFAWTVPEEVGSQPGGIKEVGLLAEQPLFFRYSKDVLSFRRWDVSDTFSMTNKGLRITLPLIEDAKFLGNWIAYLDCHVLKNGQEYAVGIPLQQIAPGGDQFARAAQATLYPPLGLEHELSANKRAIYIRKEIIKPHDAFKERGTLRLQEFLLVQIPSTHELVDRYGASREEASPQRLLAPRKTTRYWIDPLSWVNWRVVCLFEEKESVYRAQISNFIIVLGYDGDKAKPWCFVEPYNNQSLRDVWDSARGGKSNTVNEVLLNRGAIVRASLEPAVDNPAIIEVRIRCDFDFADSLDHKTLRDMDPLSVFSGTNGVAAICIKLVKYLGNCRPGNSTRQIDLSAIESSTERFIEDLEALAAANKAIQTLFQQEISKSHSSIPNIFWKQIAGCLKNCRNAVELLEDLLQDIYQKLPRADHDVRQFLKYIDVKCNPSKNNHLKNALDNISIYHKILHMSLLMGFLHDDKEGHSDTDQSTHELSREIEAAQLQIAAMSGIFRPLEKSPANATLYELTLMTRIAITDLRTCVNEAIAASKLEKSNRYFSVPRVLTTIFTGQSNLLATLKDVFFSELATTQGNQQRRFVIYGLGGSGKTEVCTKFAYENRDRYWGVFWIDFSSTETATQIYTHIAKIGGVEPTLAAAMNWLSNLKRRYLLVLDNVNSPDISLSTYIPHGGRGHILVTTRNPTCKVYGNVGSRHFLLQGLSADDANSLLLKAAAQRLPWDDQVVLKASTITKALGFHPLAICHAGRSILEGLCRLEDYLAFYERYWEVMRSKGVKKYELHEDTYLSTYSTYEIIYSYIARKDTIEAGDAIQLLNIFAFFHHNNIRFDILERAVQNLKKEIETQESNEEKDRLTNLAMKPRKLGWSSIFAHAVRSWILASQARPVLPWAIRDGRVSHHFDPDRLRSALKVLVQASLIVHNDSPNTDSYSMHPLVHVWARERPEMSLAEQALWVEAAATTLSCSILIPLRDTTAEEKLFCNAILPHVQHVLACQKSIHHHVSNRRKAKGPLQTWFNIPYTMSMTRAEINMKFSMVLTHGGLFSDAEKLQQPVMEWALRMMGIEDRSTRHVMLALAETYANLGEFEKTNQILNRVIEACEIVLGPDDPETHYTKDTLAKALLRQKRHIEAQKSQEEVTDGLKNVEGQQDQNSLL